MLEQADDPIRIIKLDERRRALYAKVNGEWVLHSVKEVP